VSYAAARRASNALKTFQPSPNFEPLWTETARRVLLRGPNRIGKTRHNCALIAQRAIDNPGTRWRFVGPTLRHVQRIAGEYLADFLAGHLADRSYYVRGRGWNGGRSKEIILANGSIIELLSYEDPPDAHEGAELDGAVLDEPPPLAHLMATQSRLFDRQGQLLIGATMINRPIAYLREMVEGGEPSPKSGRTLHGTGWVQIVGSLSIETCPWRSPDDLEEQLAILRASPWQYAQRAEGAWEGVTEGRRFVGFTEANVSHDAPSGKVKIGLFIDHGENVGHQIGILAAWRGTKLWIMDERVNETITTPEEDAHEYARMLKRNGVQLRAVDYAVGDTNTVGKSHGGWRINEALERAFADQLNRRNPPFRITYPDKTPGAKDWAQRSVNYACRRSELVVHTRCVHVLDTLRNWRGTSRPGTDDGLLAHAADALGYGLIGTLGQTPTYARLRFH